MAKWTGVVTNTGDALLASWVTGTNLNFDRAAAGSGTVPAEALLAQTGLVLEKQNASIISHETVDKGVKLKLQLTSAQAGYNLNQFGVWASVDSSPPALLAIFQNGDGIPIPAHSDTPDFVYTFYGVIAMSNKGEFTLTIDTSAVVSLGTMTDAINTAVATREPALKNATEGNSTDDTDSVVMVSGGGAKNTKRISWANIKTTLKGLFYTKTETDQALASKETPAGAQSKADAAKVAAINAAATDATTKADAAKAAAINAAAKDATTKANAAQAAAIKAAATDATTKSNQAEANAKAASVPTSRKVNNKPLTADILLAAADVGARPSTWNPTWNDVQGKPSTFPPSSHNHEIGNVNGLEQALANKAEHLGLISQTVFDNPCYPAPYMGTVSNLRGAPSDGQYRMIFVPYYACEEGWSTQILIGAVDNDGLHWRKSHGVQWQPWNTAATAEPPQEYDLPLAEGITGSAIYFRQQDGVVSLFGVFSGSISDEKVIGTLPEGYRPIYSRSVSATATSHTLDNLACTVKISSYGEIVAKNMSGISYDYLVIAPVSFVAA